MVAPKNESQEREEFWICPGCINAEEHKGEYISTILYLWNQGFWNDIYYDEENRFSS